MPARVPRRMVRFLYGHHMEEHDAPAFRRILRMLRNYFEFVTMREAIGFVRSAEPPAGRFATFSFDDGFRDNYDYIAPILDEQGARACFFVATNFIECDEQYRRWFLENRVHQALSKRPMTWEMLRTLTKAGFEVGAHTADHLNLAEVDCAEATRQILMAKDTIESRLEIPCDYFSWPYGRPSDLLPALLPLLRQEFKAVFSAMRSRQTFSFEGAAINRDHFEPSWPVTHVRYFSLRRPEDGNLPRTELSCPPKSCALLGRSPSRLGQGHSDGQLR